MKRIFFAIAIPEPTRIELLQHFREKHFHGIRWIHVDQLHITVHFVGEVAESAIETFSSRMPALCDAQQHFTLMIENFQVQFRQHKPVMIWAGIQHQRAFADLSLAVQRICSVFPGKPQLPHITLARIRQLHQLPFTLPRMKPLVIPVTSVELWESHLQAGGSSYEVLHQWKFNY